MSGHAETVVIGSTVYAMERPEGASWAVLEGPRGGIANASIVEGLNPLWRVWRGRNTTIGWVVPHGPAGLRAIPDHQAGLLVKLGNRRPDLSALLTRYANNSDRDAFNLALELIDTQGLDEAPSAAELARTLEHLTGP